jgi:hypothetical protein
MSISFDEFIRMLNKEYNTLKRLRNQFIAKTKIKTDKILEDEDFTVKIWISIPCSPWCSWQGVNLWTIEGFSEKLQERRGESRILSAYIG